MGGTSCAFEGSIAAATFNLANVAIGGGLLSFPYVISETGVVLGFLLGMGLALLMAVTAEMVAAVTRAHSSPPAALQPLTIETENAQAKEKEREESIVDWESTGGEEEEVKEVAIQSPPLTYERVVELEFGKLAGIAAVLCIIVNIFAAQVAPFIVIGDMLEPLIEAVLPDYADEWFLSREFVTATLGLFVMFPLSCTRQIDHLRFTSMLSICSISFAACVVVYNSIAFRLSDTFGDPDSEEMQQRGDIEYAVWDWSIFEAIPIIAYALSCHIQIPVIYAEMRTPSLGQFRVVAACTFFICLGVYYAAGEFGYLQFGVATDGNILQNYPSNDWLTNVARIAVTVTLLFSYPLMSFINRKALDFVFAAVVLRLRGPQESLGENDSDATTEETAFSPLASVGLAYWARVLTVTLVMMALAWTIAVLVPEIQTVFGLTGAVVTTITTFLVPPLMYWRLHRGRMLQGWLLPLSIMTIGSVIGVLGAYFTVLDLLDGS